MLWPLHWGPWANDSHVFVPFEEVVQRNFSVLAYLATIPPARVRAMQAAIAHNAHRLIYGICELSANGMPKDQSICDQFASDDATVLLLAEARRRAALNEWQMEQPQQPQPQFCQQKPLKSAAPGMVRPRVPNVTLRVNRYEAHLSCTPRSCGSNCSTAGQGNPATCGPKCCSLWAKRSG